MNVEHSSVFWVDNKRGLRWTYAQLLAALQTKSSVPEFIYSTNPLDALINLTAALSAGKATVLINGNYTLTEVGKLNIGEGHLDRALPIDLSELNSLESVIATIKARSREWRLGFFTSGTTGVPKRVDHNFSTLARNVKIAEKYRNDIWGLCFNPAHFAGIQVFLQALFNQNKIVNLFDVHPSEFSNVVETEQVRRISATPTYLRAILPFLRIHEGVRSLTSGGEKFDDTLVNQLNRIFPNARIHNIYASTEAGSLFVSHGSYFEIPESIKAKVNISSEGELWLHRDLLAVTDQIGQDEWYRTGDVVHDLGNGRIQFKHRKSDVINVGGYNVDPFEVEETLKKIPGVLDVVVRSRANSVTGGILVAEVIAASPSEQLKAALRDAAASELQPWKVPRLISFVSELKTNRSGKRERI